MCQNYLNIFPIADTWRGVLPKYLLGQVSEWLCLLKSFSFKGGSFSNFSQNSVTASLYISVFPLLEVNPFSLEKRN